VRVLLTCHHRLDPDSGAPGTTLELGAALERAGCGVRLYGFQQAFGEPGRESVGRQLRFPWQVARFLRGNARDFDVIDAMTGDGWLWASLRRPGAPERQALLTRAHGLEHVVDESARRAARNGAASLSWKYPLYHGGLRLWEVRRSLLLADHCVLLNGTDRDYARDRLGIPPERMSVMPNAIAAHFLDAADVGGAADGPLRLAFLGSWSSRKGSHLLPGILGRLLERGVDFSLSIVGADPPASAIAALPAGAAERISATPRYANDELPGLIRGCEILVFPSLSEGSSIALLEAMACGLAPVATRVGAAPEVIDPGVEGLLVEPGDAEATADAITRLAGDRTALAGMRRAAQQKARGHRWDTVAESTVRLYERVLAATTRDQ
jgi:glycosyltransferase involved in cell wall biosynthesis